MQWVPAPAESDSRLGDHVRRARTIRTVFVPVRVGGAFSEALVRTPASANDVHSEGGRCAESGLQS